MAKVPDPPPVGRLRELGPEIQALAAGTALARAFFRGGPHPTVWRQFRTFGPTASRFDHHLSGPDGSPGVQERGILYCAASGLTCLAELFQDNRVIDRRDRDPFLAVFEVTRDLELLDLTGSWPTRAGASMALSSCPRNRSRLWSRACYEAFPEIDGLLYPSSMHAHRPCIALYERARDAVPGIPLFHRALSDPAVFDVLREARHRLGYRLV